MDHRPPTPPYLLVGAALLVASEILMLARVEPFWTWHTPIAWTAYILIVDGIVFVRRGSSWLTTDRREFWFLAIVSIPLWVVFEAYNLLIDNWYYVNLPENPAVRYFGFAWAFATVSPGIFQTAELVSTIRRPSSRLRAQNALRRGRRENAPTPPPLGQGSVIDVLLIVLGAAMLIWPILWPSPYLAAPVFLGFIFLLDPVNARAGDQSLVADLRAGRYDRLINLLVGGFICGGLWEFWNYWARAKWIYTVPILGDIKIFEMPVLGYFGFPPFALECLAMYVFVRRLVWARRGGWGRPIGL